MDIRYPFEGRTERLIAVGRVVLASFSLLAIWLDPSEPAKYAGLAYVSLAAYVLYALLIAAVVWSSYGPLTRLQIATHALDIGLFSLFMYFTEGPTSPFFVYFVFSMLCATLRWQWRGTLWTAIVALAAFLGMGIYAGEILHDPAFELNRFIIRAVYLAVVALLLGSLGAHEFQRRAQLSKLASWSRSPDLDFQTVVTQVLDHASGILTAPRLLMAWEEPEEPWSHLVVFSGGRLQWERKPPGSLGSWVDPSLAGKSFFSQDVRASMAMVRDAVSSEGRRWRGRPLTPELQRLFDVKSVVSVSVSGQNFQGRLFFLDRPSFTWDDITLAEVAAGQVAASMDLFYFLQSLQQLAAMAERIRFARDIHDGVLQSLAVAGLRLEAAKRVLEENPGAAREALIEIQHIVVQEQRDLRSLIQELQLPASFGAMNLQLGEHLERLGKVVEQHWGLPVQVKIVGAEAHVPATLAREIYRIVREGLVNAARHSQGSQARVQVEIDDHQVRIGVSDNGHGFPFRGLYDHAALSAMGAGPAMLRSRIASLGGLLSIHSSDSGARLEISLPLSPPRGT